MNQIRELVSDSGLRRSSTAKFEGRHSQRQKKLRLVQASVIIISLCSSVQLGSCSAVYLSYSKVHAKGDSSSSLSAPLHHVSSLAPLQVLVFSVRPELLNVLMVPDLLQQAPAVLLRRQQVLVVRVHRGRVHAQHEALREAGGNADLQRQRSGSSKGAIQSQSTSSKQIVNQIAGLFRYLRMPRPQQSLIRRPVPAGLSGEIT